jgi:YbbR domain-containing protein
VDPGTLTVTLERTREVEVPVIPTVEGTPLAGFVVGTVKVEPAVVTVSGPESRLGLPLTAITERLLVDGHSSSIVQDVGVGIVDSQLRVLRPRTVRVTIPISRRTP